MAIQKQIYFACFALLFIAQCILTKCSASEQVEIPVRVEEFERTTFSRENDVYDQEDSSSPATITIDHEDTIIKSEPIKKQYPEFSHNTTYKRDVLIVSTMDGKITALDTEDDGKVLWQLQTGQGGLLSSSISKVELNSEGKLIRLIPSLTGGLYKFDGEGVEPIQMSADSLLHTSYLAADDLLITGGKEIQTYGVDATTGHLQYTCASTGCHIEPIETTSEGDFLIFRRHSQVVRAIEPRSGVERWNFSVGRHEATVLQTDVEAHLQTINLKPNDSFPVVDTSLKKTTGNDDKDQAFLKFKITVSDGVVNAYVANSQDNLWKHKFESSIAHAWHLKDGKLVSLDTFDTDNFPSVYDSDLSLTRPLLYVGLHNHQLYVQENSRFTISQLNPTVADDNSLIVQDKKFYWRPENANGLSPHDGNLADQFIKSISGPPAPLLIASVNDRDSCSDGKTSALAVRPEDHAPTYGGMYFYEKAPDQSTTEKLSEPESKPNPEPELKPEVKPEEEEEELWEGGRDTTVHVVIVSLWFWWREVVLISLVTALVFHVFITRQVVIVLQNRWILEFQRRTSAMNLLPILDRRSDNPETVVAIEDANHTPKQRETVEPTPEIQTTLPSGSESAITPYVSRYLTDFEPIQCLGRGGFGVVFEVRNRLDDCHYAVKRIQLPNTEAARQKVMREVKALAKLDNPHIVRYFHAWIECPPPGWQESQDARLFAEFGEALTGPTPCNTGEEESSYNESKSVVLKNDTFSSSGKLSFSKMLKSIDEARRDLTSPDDSLDIVFENSDDEESSDDENDEKSIVFVDSDSDDGIVFEHSQNEDENSVSGSSSRRELELDSTSSLLNHGKQSSTISNDNVLEPPSMPIIKKKNSFAAKRAKNSAKESRMYLYIQMQLCRKESLREWLRAQISEPDINHVLHMFNDIVRAVEYVHLQGLIHRDLKPSNIFFAPDGSIKIGDFGLVTAMAEEAYMLASDGYRAGCSPILENHTDQVGTQLYMSPEQIEGKPYSYKVDIYSLGLILFELLWPLSTQMEQVKTLTLLRDLKLPVGFDDKFPQEGKLLRKMLSREPDERPTTFGIRASAPLLRFQDVMQNPIPEHMFYDLQRPRRITE